MGDLTLATMRDEVKRNLGNRSDAGIDTRIDRFLNLAQKRIAGTVQWRELRKADTDTFTPAGNVSADRFYLGLASIDVQFLNTLIVVDNTSSIAKKLISTPAKQWDTIHPTLGATVTRGLPRNYLEWTFGSLEWWPVPTTALTVHRRYSILPADMTVDANTSVLEDKDDALIAFATSLAFGSLGQREDSTAFFIFAQRLLKQSLDLQQIKPDLDVIPRNTEAGSLTSDAVADPFVRRIL